MEPYPGSSSHLVLPARYDLREGDPALEIVDANGVPVGQVGDRVRLTARRYELADALQHADIPAECRETGAATGDPVTDIWLFVP